MKPCRTYLRSLAVAAALGASFALPAQAQDFPAKEVHIICAYAAGTGADVLVRYYAAKLQDLAGKPMIVENKAGAFGNIGAETVARAKPDGYTFLITAAAASHAANVHSFKKLPYDPVKDFEPVALLSRQAFILIVSPSSDIKSVSDLTAMLRKKGNKASYAVPNVFAQIAAELYKSIVHVQAEPVRYNATPPALTDMNGGQLDFIFADSIFAVEQAKAGRARALAISLDKRTASVPDLPTMMEAGVPGFELAGWWAAYYPAGTPKPIVDRMSGWLQQIVQTDDGRKFLLGFGNEPDPRGPDALRKFQAEQTEKIGKVFKTAGIEPQ